MIFYIVKMSSHNNSNSKSPKREMSKGRSIALKLLIGLVIAASSNILISYWYDTPKLSQLKRNNQHLEMEYDILMEKVRSAEGRLLEIKHRDQFVYRPLLGIDTLDIPQVYAEYNDSRYKDLGSGEYEEEIINGWKSIDALMRNVYYASRSLDDTQDMAEKKEEFSTVIPAIWPIDRTKLRSVSSLFGMRKHPRYGYWKMHEGVDLAAPKGTPVYATGNAVVTIAGWKPGYGQVIELNHGFGYKTRYGHLSKMYISKGDSVTRGQVIGEVGNTGVSSGSHLHYEVRFRDNTINPVHYFNKDISPESYMELMKQLEETTQK